MKKLQDTEYAYATARLRAAEGPLTARERAERIASAKTHAELIAALTGGTDTSADATVEGVNKAAAEACENAAKLVLECAPEPSLLKFLFYPADCNNIKAAVKASLREVPCDDILSDEGSVPADRLLDMLSDRDFSALPPKMREAVPAAMDAYAKNRDPQAIDFTIDAACFSDMAAGAAATKSKALIDYTKRRADAANIMTFLRSVKMRAPLPLLKRALVGGGDLEEAVFTGAYPEGAEALADALTFTGYRDASAAITDGLPADAVERILEDYALASYSGVRYQAFGIEVLAFYIVTRATEAKNARIMAASIEGGLHLADRLRAGYI